MPPENIHMLGKVLSNRLLPPLRPSFPPRVPMQRDTQRSTLSADTSYVAEVGAWAVVQGCLNTCHERLSAAGAGYAASSSEFPRPVALLSAAGPALLSAYEVREGKRVGNVAGGF